MFALITKECRERAIKEGDRKFLAEYLTASKVQAVDVDDPTKHSEIPLKLQYVPGKGLALYARHNIPKGTTIIEEQALVLIKGDAPSAKPHEIAALETKI